MLASCNIKKNISSWHDELTEPNYKWAYIILGENDQLHMK